MKNTLIGIFLGVLLAVVGYFSIVSLREFGRFDMKNLPLYSTTFNKMSNPHKDLESALKDAKVENKKVLLIVGGDWCRWCGELDNFLEDNNEIAEAFYTGYRVVKVYYGKEISKEGKSLLSQFPAIKETPHFFILENNAKLLHSIESGPLEKGYSYSKDKFMIFVQKYK